MPMTAEMALSTLSDSDDARLAGPRVRSRLDELQELLAEDLAWVERVIAEVSRQGVSPATDAARHLVTRGGKRVRPVMVLLAAACFGEARDGARHMALVSELIHSATLLHDDVTDEGRERRGAKASRLIYGNAVSVLAGDLMLVHALQRTLDHAPALMPELVGTLRSLVDGEVLQLKGRTQLDLTEATYEAILRGKTASLFVFAARVGGYFGGADSDQLRALASFGENVGMAFQLVDDALDYEGKATGKTLASDLKEGKVTLPLVLAATREPALASLVARVHQGDEGPLDAVRAAVVSSGVCADVRARARALTDVATCALERLPRSAAQQLLIRIAEELVTRGE